MDEKQDALFQVYIDDNYQQYIFEEIRRRNQVLLLEFGEDGWIYQRKWEGVVCTHPTIQTGVDDRSSDFFDDDLDTEVNKDRDFEIIKRCPDCFGTGYFGGYYKKKIIRFRYGLVPPQLIRQVLQGIELTRDFNSWTLFEPKVHEKDIMVRQNGDRHIVDTVGQSEWRGKPLHQTMILDLLEPKSITYKITDEAIAIAMQKAESLLPDEFTKFKEG